MPWIQFLIIITIEIDARMLTLLPAVITCVLGQAIDYDDNTYVGHRK